MKTIKFVAYLFYRYYSTTKGFAKDIPYAATLGVLVLLSYLHIFQILALLNKTNLIPTNGSQLKAANYLIMGLFMLPILIFFLIVIKKKELQNLRYDSKKIKRGYIYLIVYIILSFSFLMTLALIRRSVK
jgi:hypothetical protein